MQYINDDIRAIDAAIRQPLDTIIKAWEAKPEHPDDEVTPGVLGKALSQYMDVLLRAEADSDNGAGLSAEEISELGDYGITLLGDLAMWASNLSLMDEHGQLRELSPMLALWIARQGGKLHSLEMLVDTLARIANREQDPDQLKVLCGEIAEIIGAVTEHISADLEKINSGRPWRVLLVNYCIVATRSHDPDTMRIAYDILVKRLPEEAPRFFTEGMEQMDIVGYPQQVRRVMEQYHKEWAHRTLH